MTHFNTSPKAEMVKKTFLMRLSICVSNNSVIINVNSQRIYGEGLSLLICDLSPSPLMHVISEFYERVKANRFYFSIPLPKL